MENGWERLENHALLGILKAVTFCLVFILAFQRFYGNIILERLPEIFHPLDIELDVW
jgi:hypothetical protein